METVFSYVSMLSLKEICLRRVAVILWSQTDIIESLGVCDVVGKLEENIMKLQLPPLLSEKLKYLINPIGTELKNWKKFHEDYLKIENINAIYRLECLYWTVKGTIDYQKMALLLIHSGNLDIVQSYRLASLYCLEKYIPIFWGNLPEESKIYFHKDLEYVADKGPQMEFCWPYILKGEEAKLDHLPLNPFEFRPTFHQSAFQYSAFNGNKAAAEHFLQKIPHRLRERSLIKAIDIIFVCRCYTFPLLISCENDPFPEEKVTDLFCYLAFLLGPEKRSEVFRKWRCRILACLLDWPRQDLFLGIVQPNFLRPFEYFLLLACIVVKMESCPYLKKWFHENFLSASRRLIERFVVKVKFWSAFVLKGLFKVQDSETIKLIFKKLDSTLRKSLLLSPNVFCKSTERGDWHLVEMCLQEATLSEEDKQELKTRYAELLQDTFDVDANLKEDIWNQFLHFFDSK